MEEETPPMLEVFFWTLDVPKHKHYKKNYVNSSVFFLQFVVVSIVILYINGGFWFPR